MWVSGRPWGEPRSHGLDAAHIHLPAPAGMNAPAVFALAPTPGVKSGSVVNKTFDVTPVQVESLKAGSRRRRVRTSAQAFSTWTSGGRSTLGRRAYRPKVTVEPFWGSACDFAEPGEADHLKWRFRLKAVVQHQREGPCRWWFLRRRRLTFLGPLGGPGARPPGPCARPRPVCATQALARRGVLPPARPLASTPAAEHPRCARSRCTRARSVVVPV